MLKLKRSEAFERAVKAFGPWNTWSRGQHIAYGLARGVPYSSMERTANDNPHAIYSGPSFEACLVQLGVLENVPFAQYEAWRARQDELAALVVWVRKEPREHKPRVRPVTPGFVQDKESST